QPSSSTTFRTSLFGTVSSTIRSRVTTTGVHSSRRRSLSAAVKGLTTSLPSVEYSSRRLPFDILKRVKPRFRDVDPSRPMIRSRHSIWPSPRSSQVPWLEGVMDTRSGTAKRGGSPFRSRAASSSLRRSRSKADETTESKRLTSSTGYLEAVETTDSGAAWVTLPKANSTTSQASVRLISDSSLTSERGPRLRCREPYDRNGARRWLLGAGAAGG